MPKITMKSGAAAGAAVTPVCAVCGVEAPGNSRCAGCRNVNYCSREHQKQHWKTGGHREACGGICTRCLDPMSANNGRCFVDHPSHLRREGEKTVVHLKMPGAPRSTDVMCTACDNQLTTMNSNGCRDCAEDCGAIVKGPLWCFEGKHTLNPLPVSDKRRVWRDVVTVLPRDHLQRKIDALLSPENEAKVTVLNFPNGGCDDKITASINHRMSNLTTLRIMDMTLVELRLTADLTPKLVELEVRNIPQTCKFHVVVPTLKKIWIHHYTPPEHSSGCINDMLAAATALETFETYKLWVSEELRFASNHLKSIELYRSDGLSGISLWAPNLEKLVLRACFSIKNIEIVKSHQLAEELPEGHEPTTIRVNTANANISPRAMNALKKSGRCLFEDNDPDDDGPLGTEAMYQFMHKNTNEDDGPLGMMKAMMAWSNMQFEGMKK